MGISVWEVLATVSVGNLAYTLADIVDFFEAQTGIERQRDNPSAGIGGVREILGRNAEDLLIIGQVEYRFVMNTAFDAVFGQSVDEGISFDAEPRKVQFDYKQMPAVLAVTFLQRKFKVVG